MTPPKVDKRIRREGLASDDTEARLDDIEKYLADLSEFLDMYDWKYQVHAKSNTGGNKPGANPPGWPPP